MRKVGKDLFSRLNIDSQVISLAKLAAIASMIIALLAVSLAVITLEP
jgi:hypothetical protein